MQLAYRNKCYKLQFTSESQNVLEWNYKTFGNVFRPFHIMALYLFAIWATDYHLMKCLSDPGKCRIFRLITGYNFVHNSMLYWCVRRDDRFLVVTEAIQMLNNSVTLTLRAWNETKLTLTGTLGSILRSQRSVTDLSVWRSVWLL